MLSNTEVRSKPLIKLREVPENERDYWNQAVATLPTGHILQTFEWGEFKSHYGWQPIRLLFMREDHCVAAALVLKRKIPIPGYSILYVPKGPCFDPTDSESVEFVLESLKSFTRTHRALFIKLDPDVLLNDNSTVSALTTAGFQPSKDQIQFRNTMIVDLQPSVEELRSNLSKTARYNTNMAQRKGVEIIEGTANDLPLFYDIYRETSERDHFLIRPYEYYEHIWRSFLDKNMAKIHFASYEGTTLSGSILLLLGNRAWYMYGASRSIHRELRPNHLLQWEAMLWAKNNGFVYYDMWGLPNKLEPGQPMWGVVEFKKSLGGQVRQWIGAYDYVYNPVLYKAWTELLPRYLHFLRRLRGLPSAEGD